MPVVTRRQLNEENANSTCVKGKPEALVPTPPSKPRRVLGDVTNQNQNNKDGATIMPSAKAPAPARRQALAAAAQKEKEIEPAKAETKMEKVPSVSTPILDSPAGEALFDHNGEACEDETVLEAEALISNCFNRLQQRGIPYVDAASQVRLLEVLGEGAFASVHRGVVMLGAESQAGQPSSPVAYEVAVKNTEMGLDEPVEDLCARLAAFEQEACMAYWAGHEAPPSLEAPRQPNNHMLKVMGVSCLIHHELNVVEMYLLMELVPGGDLCSFINHPKGSWVEVTAKNQHQYPPEAHYLDMDDNGDTYVYVVPFEIKVQLALQLAQILIDLERRKIVHRDIKPANIMLSKVRHPEATPILKLTDFGEASFAGCVSTSRECVGTRGYMAPETEKRANNRQQPLTCASDTYSMGVTLLELFTGAVWQGAGEHDYLALKGEVASALRSVRRVDPKVADLVDRCLLVEPANRISASELKSSFLALLPSAEGTSHPTNVSVDVLYASPCASPHELLAHATDASPSREQFARSRLNGERRRNTDAVDEEDLAAAFKMASLRPSFT